MDVITIEGAPRKPGKSSARAARREGQVPCVLYGPGFENVTLQVPVLALKQLIYTSQAHRVELKVNRKKWPCVLKQMSFHPLSDTPTHVDFQVLVEGSKITLMVPVQYHGVPIGQVQDGGETQFLVHELEVTCLPDQIPSQIDVEISHLQIGDSIHLGDLTIEDIEVSSAADRTLVTVVAPRVVEEPVEEVAEEVEGEVAGTVEEAEEAAQASRADEEG